MLEIAFVWLLFAIAVGIAAGTRGRSGFGWFLLAIIFSPLIAGVFVLALGNLKERIEREERAINSRPCPHCAEMVLRKAIVCRHCGSDIPKAPAAPLFAMRPSRIPGALVALFIVGAIVWAVTAKNTPPKPAAAIRSAETTATAYSVAPLTEPPIPTPKAPAGVPLPKPRPK